MKKKMNIVINKSNIKYCRENVNTIDPYEMIINKSNRLSWNGLSAPDEFIDKANTIAWFSLLRGFSDELLESIITKGIFDNHFHKMSYIFDLSDMPGFVELPSSEVYMILHQFVDKTPVGIKDFLDVQEFELSLAMLAILANKIRR